MRLLLRRSWVKRARPGRRAGAGRRGRRPEGRAWEREAEPGAGLAEGDRLTYRVTERRGGGRGRPAMIASCLCYLLLPAARLFRALSGTGPRPRRAGAKPRACLGGAPAGVFAGGVRCAAGLTTGFILDSMRPRPGRRPSWAAPPPPPRPGGLGGGVGRSYSVRGLPGRAGPPTFWPRRRGGSEARWVTSRGSGRVGPAEAEAVRILRGPGPLRTRGRGLKTWIRFDISLGSTPQSPFRATSLRSVWLKNNRIQNTLKPHL